MKSCEVTLKNGEKFIAVEVAPEGYTLWSTKVGTTVIGGGYVCAKLPHNAEEVGYIMELVLEDAKEAVTRYPYGETPWADLYEKLAHKFENPKAHPSQIFSKANPDNFFQKLALKLYNEAEAQRWDRDRVVIFKIK